jgi:glycerol-3-phosphate dehydrogenase
VVNAAGINSDIMNNYISDIKYENFPRKGEYILFDRSAGDLMSRTIFQLPTRLGKGVLVSPTVHDNLFIGPSAEDVEDRTSKATTAESMEQVIAKSRLICDKIPMNKIITSFTGLRSCLKQSEDFSVGEAPDAPGFINCLGINSPGLSAAPAIAVSVAAMVCGRLQPALNNGFIADRQPIKLMREQDIDEQNRMIAGDNRYGVIVCRCETATEGDIVDAIRRPLGARTVDAVKRRVRAGMGRCQGGFCGSKVLEILARELGMSVQDITKFGRGSKIIEAADRRQEIGVSR